jgi:hypothetical protein
LKPIFAASRMNSRISSVLYPHGLQSTQILITRAPNRAFFRTAFTISSGVSASRYSGYTMFLSTAISGEGQNCPPMPPMMIPELMIVGPGIQPCSIAWRSAASAKFPALPMSRTMVKPASSIWIPFDTA